ncbi:hypothetical protein ACQ4WX_32995 [Streptomyces lasalocidi]
MCGDGVLDLGAQAASAHQARSRTAEGGDRGERIEVLLGERAEGDGEAEGRGVVGDAGVVAEDAVGGDQGLAPAVEGIDRVEAGPARVVQPGADLAGPVAVPDVRMQDRDGPVLVGQQLRREAGQQPGQQIVRRRLGGSAEEGRAAQVELTTISR